MPRFDCHKTEHIFCPTCGKEGAVIWELAARARGDGKDLVRIEGDFYERLSRKPPFPIELICHVCGTAQHGPLQAR